MRKKPLFIVFVSYLFSICLALLFLIFVEGLFTLGAAFNFKDYSFVAWIAQISAILFVCSAAILITHKELK